MPSDWHFYTRSEFPPSPNRCAHLLCALSQLTNRCVCRHTARKHPKQRAQCRGWRGRLQRMHRGRPRGISVPHPPQSTCSLPGNSPVLLGGAVWVWRKGMTSLILTILPRVPRPLLAVLSEVNSTFERGCLGVRGPLSALGTANRYCSLLRFGTWTATTTTASSASTNP